MSQETRDYVEKKIVRPVWNATFRFKDEKPKYKKQTQFLTCIDPESLKILKIYESIQEMEYDTDTKNLQPILNRYFKGLYKKPTICEYIVVPFYRKELRYSLEEFKETISKRAIDRVLNMKMQKIKDKVYSNNYESKKAYYSVFNTILKTFTNNTEYEINF